MAVGIEFDAVLKALQTNRNALTSNDIYEGLSLLFGPITKHR